MKKRFSVILIFACLLSLCACSAVKNVQEANTVKTDAQEQGGERDEKITTISTPYADICVPEYFNGNVTHKVKSENPYTLTFKANDGTELFTLIFNGTGDVLMGTLVSKSENTVIYMNVPTINKENEKYETYCGYQSAVNTIANHLEKDYDFRINEAVVEENTATADIEGAPIPMKYPEKWKNAVQTEVEKDRIKFSNNGVPLFDLVFTRCDGYLLGTYKDTPIYIIDYDVSTDEQLAMQEDVNVILQGLMDDPNFKINN